MRVSNKKIILVLFALLLQSCSMNDFVIHIVKKGPPHPDYFYIHKNPKPGDYTILKANSEKPYKTKVVSVKDDIIEVHSYQVFKSGKEEDLVSKYYVTRQGKLIRRTMGTRGDSDDKFEELPIAKMDKGGYFNNIIYKRLPKPETIQTKGGIFTITHLMAYTFVHDGINISVVKLIDENAKFGVVKQAIDASSTLNLGDIANDINILDPDSPTPFVNYFTKQIVLMIPSMFRREFEIIETN